MRQTFSDLIMGRREADQSAAAFLERLVTQYPYCQAGQMLYARALQKAADPSFDQQMNRAMATAPDRRHFRYFLSIRPEQNRMDYGTYDPEEVLYSGSSGKTAGSGSGQASADTGGHKNKQLEIIDRFLRVNPRIEARKDKVSDGEMAPESLEDHPELISETLAEIHIKQGKTDRALDIYKKLSLKFPEKSSYFAKKIESIERKTNNI